MKKTATQVICKNKEQFVARIKKNKRAVLRTETHHLTIADDKLAIFRICPNFSRPSKKLIREHEISESNRDKLVQLIGRYV